MAEVLGGLDQLYSAIERTTHEALDHAQLHANSSLTSGQAVLCLRRPGGPRGVVQALQRVLRLESLLVEGDKIINMYSEIDDQRRRHSTYTDYYNMHGWIETEDAAFGHTALRGAWVGLLGSLAGELGSFYFHQYKLIRTKYDPPESLAQITSYFRAAHSMPNTRSSLMYRAHSALFSTFDWTCRMLSYRFFVGGYAQGTTNGVNFDFGRRAPAYYTFALFTAPICVPLSAAKSAYKADLTFPPELRAGYRSPTDALFSIAKTKPLNLFRNGIPYFIASYLQTSLLMFTYELIFEIWTPSYHELRGGSRALAKFTCALGSAMVAAGASYPLIVTLNNAIDIFPRQISRDMLGGSVRKAMYYVWTQDYNGMTMWAGWIRSGFFFKAFPSLFAIVWVADSYGFFRGARYDPFEMPVATSWQTRFM